jgi:hypothetical protein
VERTLVDITLSSDTSLLRDAVSESLERGLTTRRRLARAIIGRKTAQVSAGISAYDCRLCGSPRDGPHDDGQVDRAGGARRERDGGYQAVLARR